MTKWYTGYDGVEYPDTEAGVEREHGSQAWGQVRLVNFLASEHELSITLTNAGYDELVAGASFADLIEYHLANGWEATTADTIGCLSSAPVLVYGSAENLQLGQSEPLWYYYPDYQVRDETDDLRRAGVVVYKRGY